MFRLLQLFNLARMADKCGLDILHKPFKSICSSKLHGLTSSFVMKLFQDHLARDCADNFVLYAQAGFDRHSFPSAQRAKCSHISLSISCFATTANNFLRVGQLTQLDILQLRYGRKHGVQLTPTQVLENFRAAYNTPWGSSTRYNGDARDFWRRIVQMSLGCDEPSLFEDIYEYYSHESAWIVQPGLEDALTQVRQAGVTICVVSNFDTRLRPLLHELRIDHLFDHIVISAEVGHEKPSPVIFEAACRACGVDPAKDFILHVGDDRRNDVWGARDSGLSAWLWGIDVDSFDEVAERVTTGDTAI